MCCLSSVIWYTFDDGGNLCLFLVTCNTQSFQLEDNCIVFENFTAAIGDLMVAN